jgi:hypothetical protein
MTELVKKDFESFKTSVLETFVGLDEMKASGVAGLLYEKHGAKDHAGENDTILDVETPKDDLAINAPAKTLRAVTRASIVMKMGRANRLRNNLGRNTNPQNPHPPGGHSKRNSTVRRMSNAPQDRSQSPTQIMQGAEEVVGKVLVNMIIRNSKWKTLPPYERVADFKKAISKLPTHDFWDTATGENLDFNPANVTSMDEVVNIGKQTSEILIPLLASGATGRLLDFEKKASAQLEISAAASWNQPLTSTFSGEGTPARGRGRKRTSSKIVQGRARTYTADSSIDSEHGDRDTSDDEHGQPQRKSVHPAAASGTWTSSPVEELLNLCAKYHEMLDQFHLKQEVLDTVGPPPPLHDLRRGDDDAGDDKPGTRTDDNEASGMSKAPECSPIPEIPRHLQKRGGAMLNIDPGALALLISDHAGAAKAAKAKSLKNKLDIPESFVHLFKVSEHKSNTKTKGKLKGVMTLKGVLPHRLLHKFIWQIYKDKIETDRSDDSDHQERQPLPDFVYDWNVNKYGLKKLAQEQLMKVFNTLKQDPGHDPTFEIFARFLGIEDLKGGKATALPIEALNIFLDVLEGLLNCNVGKYISDRPKTGETGGRGAFGIGSMVKPESGLKGLVEKTTLGKDSGGGSKGLMGGGLKGLVNKAAASGRESPEKIQPGRKIGLKGLLSKVTKSVSERSNHAVSLNRALFCFRDILLNKFIPNEMSKEFCEDVEAIAFHIKTENKAQTFPIPELEQSSYAVDTMAYLGLILEAWEKLHAQAIENLKSLFDEGDINGDGCLTYDEFCDVTSHADPTLHAGVIRRMFRECTEEDDFGTELMRKERFVEVGLKHGLFSYRSAFKSDAEREKAEEVAVNEMNDAEEVADNVENSYLMLENAWESSKAQVEEVIAHSKDETFKSYMNDRIKIMEELMSEKVDSEAAWMTYRIIVKEGVASNGAQQTEAGKATLDRRRSTRLRSISHSLMATKKLSQIISVKVSDDHDSDSEPPSPPPDVGNNEQGGGLLNAVAHEFGQPLDTVPPSPEVRNNGGRIFVRRGSAINATMAQATSHSQTKNVDFLPIQDVQNKDGDFLPVHEIVAGMRKELLSDPTTVQTPTINTCVLCSCCGVCVCVGGGGGGDIPLYYLSQNSCFIL